MSKIIELIMSNLFLFIPIILFFFYLIFVINLKGISRKFLELFIVLEEPKAHKYKPDGYKLSYNSFNPNTSSCRGCGSNLRVNGKCGHCGC